MDRVQLAELISILLFISSLRKQTLVISLHNSIQFRSYHIITIEIKFPDPFITLSPFSSHIFSRYQPL